MEGLEEKVNKINKIIIHCSYTKSSMDIGAKEIKDWHVNDNGWSDIGYHYIIRRDGKIEKGRPDNIPGAHARGHNNDSIGICLVGGMGMDEKADCNFVRAQWMSLETLVSNLKKDHDQATIYGHRDLDDDKECPCFDAKSWWGMKVH